MINLDHLLSYYWRNKPPPLPSKDNKWRNKWRITRHLFPIRYGKERGISKATVIILVLVILLGTSIRYSYGTMLSDQKNLIFDRLGTQDGLSQAVVLSIEQDDQGFIWLGTQEGLNLFNGYSFEKFFHEDANQASLSHDWILDLLVDSSGRLWVATDGGLNRYDSNTRSFIRYQVYEDESGLRANSESVQVLYEDSKRTLWVGTDRGLSRYLGEGKFEHFIHDDHQDSISQGGVSAIYEDSQGNMWIGTDDGGLNLYQRNLLAFKRFEATPTDSATLVDNHVRTILEVEPGRLWVGTFNGGISILDMGSGNFTSIQHDPHDPGSLSSNRVRGLLKDRKGNLWVAADGGLNLWLPESNSFQRFTNDTTDANSLSNDTVTTLFEDSGGVIWVGTYSGGVSKWNNNIATFPHIRNRIGDPYSLSDNQVTSFAEGYNDELWVGTTKGLNYWNPATGRFSVIHEGEHNLSSNVVMSLLFDSKGRLWVGTINKGLNLRAAGEEDFTNFRNDTESGNSISSNKISKIYEDSRARIWVTTYGGGINLYKEDGTFQRFPLDSKGEMAFSSLRAVDILEDEQGTLWIATDGGGVTLLDPDQGKTRFLRHDPQNKSSLSSDHAISLLRAGNEIWVGTRDTGINYYDPEKAGFVRYDKRSGLSSDAIYGMIADEQNRLWISGNKGLSVLDPRTNTSEAYDSTHGLQSNDFNNGAVLKTTRGYFLFGGSNGFNIFDPNSIHGNDYVPPIRLTRFTKFNKPVDLGVDLASIKQIELDYSDYVIGFEFSAMDFTAPEKNRFRYMLEGFDRDWVEVNGVHQATYTNLDAGNYEFKIIGSNNDNVWNLNGLSVGVVVRPPIWATWWAYLAYFILAVLALGSISRAHTRKLKRDAEERYNQELQLYIESLEEASDCVLIADDNGTLKYANNAVYSMMGLEPGGVRGKPMLSLLFSSERDAEQAREVLAQRDRWHGEVLNRRGLEDYPVEVTISKVRRGKSNETAYVCIARDITERKKIEAELETHRQKLEELVGHRTEALSREIVEHKAAQRQLANSLQEKELLLKEVHHRVKNNMQVISSLLNIQAETIEDEKFSALLGESQQRIKSMALIHENLYQSDDLLGINFQEYIEMLGNSLCRFYPIKNVSVNMIFDIDEISLDIETALPCGLIINELISNSLKHAYSEHEGVGNIEVSFKRFEDSYILSIKDDGKGMPKDFSFDNISSMGMEIICILTNQLDGNIQLIMNKGTTFRVSFPNRQELWRAQA